MPLWVKDWDRHVVHAETLARRSEFQALRDRLLELASPSPDETAVDVGSGTGLLTLALADRVERVWAIDISPAMGEYLRVKAASAGRRNVEVATASAASLPLVGGMADLVVSNYCFHHLDAEGKRQALAEAFRVLRPGGRLVFGDMMFRIGLTEHRDRELLARKVRALMREGAPGMLRLARAGVRTVGGSSDRPAHAEWWRQAVVQAGFCEVRVDLLEHEIGIASARRPAA